MTIEALEDKIKSKLALASHLNETVNFDCGKEGVIHVNAKQSPAQIKREDKPATLTLAASLDTMHAILDGRQDPNIAFMMGKLKVKGPMGLAMKLNALLED
ncbi:MAG: SCP2 sterol-binding domain-containing protein [Micavibrio sp.]|nr:SCP2 sterol-binding domain-containing protein [Micavibrio sp.]